MGSISYPLFLWHWPLLSFARIVTGHPSTGLIFLCLTLSVVLSVVTYLTIENFLRFERGGSRWRAPVLAAVLVALFLFVGFAGIEPKSKQLKVDRIAKINAAMGCNEAGNWEYPTAGMVRRQFADGFSYYEMKTRNPHTVLFVGDSLMEPHAARIQQIAGQHPDTIMSSLWITRHACLAAQGFIRHDAQQYEEDCLEMAHKILDLLRDGRPGPIERVVWSQNWSSYLVAGGKFALQISRQRLIMPSPRGRPSLTASVLDPLAEPAGTPGQSLTPLCWQRGEASRVR